MAAMDQLTNLANLLQTVQGSETEQKTKSRQTQTTQTQISDAGVNKLIQDILSGPGGVRSIGGAARQTGLFNSTTEDMLLGDLTARAAVSAELARSPTTVNTSGTTTTTAETPGIGLGGIGGAIALAQGGKLLFGDKGKGGLLEGAGDAIANLFGGAGGAATTGTTAALAGAPAASQALAGATGSAAVNAGVAGTAGAALGTSAAGAGTAAGAGQAGAAAGSGFGMNAATAIPLGGSFLSGLIGGKDAATEPGSLAMSAMAGAMALGPIGLIAAPLAAVAGGFLRDMSVICTALMEKGLVSKELHANGDTYFQKLPVIVKVGYWMWGMWVSKKIRAGSVFWTRFTLPVVKSYLRYLGGASAFSEPLGAVAHYIGEPICKMLGKTAVLWATKIKSYL